jgi:NAD(P)-dependent dehydrogenase (short-subunit alcohol dehydrogenase family)
VSDTETTTARPLDGKVAIITGASRGIRAAVARAFSDAGAAVALAARDQDALADLADELTATGGLALAVPTDVRDADAVARMVEQTVDAFGRLDVACNNAAGGGHRPTLLADVLVEDFDSSYAVTSREETGRPPDTGREGDVRTRRTRGTRRGRGLARRIRRHPLVHLRIGPDPAEDRTAGVPAIA